jgi:hypothetical protein
VFHHALIIFIEVREADPATHSLTLLGTFPGTDGHERLPAVLRVEKTVFDPDTAEDLISWISGAKIIESTDIVRSTLDQVIWF